MTASITMVRDALAALLETIPGESIIIDRPRGDALTEDEAPATVINMGDPAFDLFEGNATMLHTAQIDLEIYAKAIDGGPSIADQQADRVAKIVAKLGTDTFLGGRLQDLSIISQSGSEANAADIGAITLALQATWFTPPWDFETIQGQSGLFT
jgi:hypothetical protein